jgi:hypothetical protein
MLLRLITISLTSIFLVSCNQKDSKIYGTWKSDGERTWDYIQEHAKLTEQQQTSLSTFFGNATVTYNPDGTGVVNMTEHTIEVLDSDPIQMAASSQEFTFEVVAESKLQAVIKVTSDFPLSDDYPYSLIRFEDDGAISVSLNESISDLAGREFFTRIN